MGLPPEINGENDKRVAVDGLTSFRLRKEAEVSEMRVQ